MEDAIKSAIQARGLNYDKSHVISVAWAGGNEVLMLEKTSEYGSVDAFYLAAAVTELVIDGYDGPEEEAFKLFFEELDDLDIDSVEPAPVGPEQ